MDCADAKENITPDKPQKTSPGQTRAKLATASLSVRSSELEEEVISAQPQSPTDQLLSPCTKKLMGAKKLHKPRVGLLQQKKPPLEEFTLEAELLRRNYRYPARRLPLILGSSSSNRREVLQAVNWEHSVVTPDIDEKAIRCEDPRELPLLIAQAKADAVIKKIIDAHDAAEKASLEEAEIKPFVLLTCDQIVLFNGSEMREKPESAGQAQQYLQSYSNGCVSTISAVVATHYPSLVQDSGIDEATVHWKAIDDETVQRVVARGEVMTSAGGFRIEDPDLQPLVRRIDGTVDSVMGMPLALASSLAMNVVTRLSLSSRSEESL